MIKAYDSVFYLTLAGRNDWVSNLAPDNRALFYPSASLSFVPTTAFEDLKGDALGYLKFRAGYGTSAGFPDQNSDSYPVAKYIQSSIKTMIFGNPYICYLNLSTRTREESVQCKTHKDSRMYECNGSSS